MDVAAFTFVMAGLTANASAVDSAQPSWAWSAAFITLAVVLLLVAVAIGKQTDWRPPGDLDDVLR